MRKQKEKVEALGGKQTMKKRLLALALCLCTIFSVAACGDEETKGEKTEGKLTLGEYKGIKVDASLKEVAEEDLQAYLDSVLKSKAVTEEIKEGTIAKDDTIKFDCTITVDGEEYNTVTGEEMVLEYEAGKAESGFPIGDLCAGIIGKNIGEEFELALKYGDDYTDTKVAGKDATFKVKLIAKLNTVVPEFTDEFVATNFDYLSLSTKQDLLDYLEHDIVINQVYGDIWENVILANSTAESYDSDDLAAMTEEYKEYQEYYIYQMTGGYSLSDYLSAVGMSEEDFTKQMEEAAKVYLKQEMLVHAIAEKENIVITDEIYAAEMLEFAKSYGYDTVEAFEEAYSDMTREDFEYTVLTYLVQELVCDSVEFVEGQGLYTPEEEPSSENESTSGEGETGESDTTTAATK